MRPLIDLMSKTTVTATTYTAANKYTLQANGRWLLLREISVATDSNFQTNGYIQGFIAGTAWTQQNGVLTEVSPLQTFTARYSDDDFVVLSPGDKLEINFRVTTGTGVVQVLTTGVELTQQEYDALRTWREKSWLQKVLAFFGWRP